MDRKEKRELARKLAKFEKNKQHEEILNLLSKYKDLSLEDMEFIDNTIQKILS